MEGWATIIAALLGAGIGSLGAQILGEQSRKQQLIEATKRDVAVHHLMQLQDALESLWFRFVNPEVDKAQRQAEDQAGDQKVDEAADEYYEQSSLFVLANALAQIRLLVVEGALRLSTCSMTICGERDPKPWNVRWDRLDKIAHVAR